MIRPCPFCGCELQVRERKCNPYARCATEDCKGAQLPLLNIDQPDDIQAWNRRAPPDSPGWKSMPPKLTPEMRDAMVDAARDYLKSEDGISPDVIYEAAFAALDSNPAGS